MKRSIITLRSLAAWLALATLALTACSDQPDEYKPTGGSPQVQYIRLPESADSIITQSYMQRTICLVGSNLRSVRRMFFNDKEAVLNSSFITDNTLLVDIPR